MCKKFVFLATTVSLSEIHINRPYFELTKAMSKRGYCGILVCGSTSVVPGEDTKIYQTGISSDRHIDTVKVFRKTLQILLAERPNIAVIFHMNLLISALITMYRIVNFLSPRKGSNNTTWVLKLDWDGSGFQGTSSIGMKLRNLFLCYNSIFVDYIVAENSCSAESTRILPFVDRNKIKVIPNSYSSAYPLVKYSETKRENIVLCVARVSPEKGIDILVECFKDLSERFSNWSLVVAGPIENKAYFHSLSKRIEQTPNPSAIKFTGFVSQSSLSDLYRKASVFCLPSIKESFGLTRVEAIANGLPVITTSAGCGEDFEKYGSVVVPSGDISLLKDALSTLMSDLVARIAVSEKQQLTYPNYDLIADMFASLEIV